MDTDDATWRQAFETVFLGTVRLVRDVSPAINDGGAIVLVLAVTAREAAPTLPISNGLRPGLALLAKNFADELGPRNIRVNTLLPNLFATGRVQQLLGTREPPAQLRLPIAKPRSPPEPSVLAAVRRNACTPVLHPGQAGQRMESSIRTSNRSTWNPWASAFATMPRHPGESF